MEELKAKGLDFMIYVITFIVTVLSYTMTIEILDDANIAMASEALAKSLQATGPNNIAVNESIILNFLRSSFVFISPCALEGINLFCNKITKKGYIDIIEIVIGVISIIASIYLFIIVFEGTIPSNLSRISWVLSIYPLKFGINLFSEFFDLIRLRRLSK